MRAQQIVLPELYEWVPALAGRKRVDAPAVLFGRVPSVVAKVAQNAHTWWSMANTARSSGARTWNLDSRFYI